MERYLNKKFVFFVIFLIINKIKKRELNPSFLFQFLYNISYWKKTSKQNKYKKNKSSNLIYHFLIKLKWN